MPELKELIHEWSAIHSKVSLHHHTNIFLVPFPLRSVVFNPGLQSRINLAILKITMPRPRALEPCGEEALVFVKVP